MKYIVAIITGLVVSILGVVLIGNLFFKTTEEAKIQNSIVVNEESPRVLNDISVSIILHPIRNSGDISTARSDVNILSVLDKAQVIWDVAGIRFDTTFKQTELDLITQKELASGNNRALYSTYSLDDSSIHIFFRQGLTANGIAMGPSIALINDTTTVNDFRATAHEIGHLLGLEHNAFSATQLMYQGVNGDKITEKEIAIARDRAKFFDKF